MNLSEVKLGQCFGLEEMGETIPFVAIENSHLIMQEGNEYYTVMARNLMSNITIPLTVHKEYQHYLRLSPLFWSDKPEVKMVWDNERT